jgi:hypothetical protein
MKLIGTSTSITSDNDFLYQKLDSKWHNSRDFIIVIHDLSNFFENKENEKSIFFKIDNLFETEKDMEYLPLPVIHTSLFDFFDDEDMGKIIPNLPRYKNIIDSDIWNYYVPYYRKEEDFGIRLNNVITEITNNKKIGLYKCRNAKEIIEFKSRILQQSYIASLGGHGDLVAPFLFHSEAKMKKKAVVYKKENEDKDAEKCELEKLEENGSLQWRFLIVDDHATKQSAETESCKADIVPKCKIIYNILSEYFNIKCHRCECNKDDTAKRCWEECHSKNSTINAEKSTIWLDCATEMNEAINKLAETKYDLILMDYLLDTNKETRTRNYAYDLLHQIEDNVKKEKWTIKNNKIGPNAKFQMFYISAFTNAVRERMLEQGLDYNSDYWYISHGACPTTTPHLFLFYLLRRMNSQIKEFTELSTKHSKKEDLKDIITLLDLLQEIYGSDKESTRRQAIKLFNPLLKLRLNYNNLKYDVYDVEKKEMLPEKNASKLISSLFPDIEFYDNAFWEHTMHLVYLTAYGTIRQWHEMWDEFMLIKPCLQKANKKIEIAEAVIKGIEKYITNLQNDQSK